MLIWQIWIVGSKLGKKLTLDFCKENAKERGFELISKKYNGNTSKLKFKHLKCSYVFKTTWVSFWGNRKSGGGCPKCANNIMLNISECKRRARARGYKVISKEYFGNGEKLEFKHITCGYIFKMQWNNFNNGQNCPKCSHEIKPTIEDCKDYASKRGYSLITDFYRNAHQKFKMIHLDCGNEINILWTNFYHSEQGCSFCFGKNKPTIQECKRYARTQEHILKSEKYVNERFKMVFKHIICGEEYVSNWSHFKSGRRCPMCKESRGERTIRLFLKNNHINFIRQYRYSDCKYKKPLPFDFYIPELNLLIEYHGEQHYKPAKWFSKKEEKVVENFRLQKIRDRIKRKYAKDNGINFLIISYKKIKKIENILEKEILNGEYLQ